MDIDWNLKLDEQLSWHWDNAIRPRMEGLTDEEYRALTDESSRFTPVTGAAALPRMVRHRLRR